MPEAGSDLVHQRDDLVSLLDGQSAAGDEVVLDIHDHEQGPIVRRDLARHALGAGLTGPRHEPGRCRPRHHAREKLASIRSHHGTPPDWGQV